VVRPPFPPFLLLKTMPVYSRRVARKRVHE
jgi:hypothetical protein